MVWRRGEQEGDQWGEDIKCLMISECDCSQSGPRPPSVECSAVKRSIGFTICFHNHGEGPYYAERALTLWQVDMKLGH